LLIHSFFACQLVRITLLIRLQKMNVLTIGTKKITGIMIKMVE
jgi:hypothetical protein